MSKAKAKNAAPQEGENATPPSDDATLDNLAASIAADAPVAQPNVIAAYNADKKEAPLPEQKPLGEKARGRPRKPDIELKEPRRVKVPKKDTPSQEQAKLLGHSTNGETAAFVTAAKEQLLVGFIGPEWQLTSEEKAVENHFLTASLDKYAPEGLPVNPLAMYAVISATHASKRFSQPATRTWWERTKTKAAAWWLTRKMKKEGRQNAAYADSRANNDGKNNASDPTRAQNQGGAPLDSARP